MYSRTYAEYPIREISLAEAPPLLNQIPKPPKRFFVIGDLPLQRAAISDHVDGEGRKEGEYIYLTIVGSRKYTEYAKQACESLIAGLRGLPVVIISGLALGIDSIAHQAALKNGLKTIAVPGSGLNERALYPPTHLGLATEILANGGALVSHFDNDTVGAPWTFPNRNRIMAGISHATLVIEADIKSGTLITSKFATDFNRDVLAVPGSIFSPQSTGPHMLIRSGATPITCPTDLRDALGFEEKGLEQKSLGLAHLYMSPIERAVVDALKINLSRENLFEVIVAKGIDASEINVAISLLEMNNCIEYVAGEFRLRRD